MISNQGEYWRKKKERETKYSNKKNFSDKIKIISDIIEEQGQIKEVNLILKLQSEHDISFWVYSKIKPRLFELNPNLHINKKLHILYTGNLNESLVSLSFSEKEQNR